MDARLHQAITERLERDFSLKRKKEWLQAGECPSCRQKELYTNADHPWILRCNRTNKCGYEEHVKELYSDLFESWSERFPKQPENPNATADAYMESARGFSLDIVKGWYAQESYFDHEKNIGSATVRFTLPGIGYWERIIDRPHRFGKRKATFRGNYGGTWWQPPSLSWADLEELWIVEGIFDAIALLHNGISAVSTLTTNNYPSTALDGLLQQLGGAQRPRLVFAFDGDKAGRKFTEKYVTRARQEGWDAVAAQIPQGKKKQDWNDLHLVGRLQAKNIEEYRYHGDLLMAGSAAEKANLIYLKNCWQTFPFDFDSRLWWFKLDLERFGKASDDIREKSPDLSDDEIRERAILESGTVSEIANCLPVPLYNLRSDVTDESWYYFRIEFPHDGPAVKGTFTAGQITSDSEFKKRLLHLGAGAYWFGNKGQLDKLASRWTYNIKTVQTLDYIGYSIDHRCYVWNEVAAAGGQIYTINDEDYFDIEKLSIKSLFKSIRLDINPDLKAYRTDWFEKLYLCFGPRGVIALASWFGSLFAEQLRADFESWPFVEIVGEPGAGKSTLIETMWKLLGRNGHEGDDPMKGSMVGLMRTMAQVSNLPVVLIESDREESPTSSVGRAKAAFHWDQFKSLFNGGSLRTTGVKSSGLDTYTPQFRGALFISQNAPVSASKPIMERIVHVWFDKARQSQEGREAALALGRMTAYELSGFMVKATRNEAAVLSAMEERLRDYEKAVQLVGVKNLRVQKNHAQLMVMIDCLSMACPISPQQQQEAKELMLELAIEREQTLEADPPVVAEFWDLYEYLEGLEDEAVLNLNHSRDSDQTIAINLNHFIEVATDRRQKIPDLLELKKLLPHSKRHKFIEANKVVNSAINAAFNARVGSHTPKRASTVKCWIFEAKRSS
ncbi:toprim domain-containing protein [Paludibacterium paludis]|uniref:Toprim domain-containing protein n=1 Tax=Paludibacterium paludis TaxID=1225769 RepID=A0A918U6N9_9NEIS|nr:toprim domain-containing protein [Paludibacterium paludis]GGY03654.1 hypothetical protein GCM10011289_02490 [Paludibacterium paludis]